tara:strand:- start:206 stop:664 length:459 start_codon:yes stop_codon:yes gene_type:complete
MLIFTEEIIQNNPGLRTYLHARPYLEELDLDYEDDNTLENFLEFVPKWLTCMFSEFEKSVLKILRGIINLSSNNPIVMDLKRIINNKYYDESILNYITVALFDEGNNYNLNCEERLETLYILFKLGAIPDQKDLKNINKHKNYFSKIEKLFN